MLVHLLISILLGILAMWITDALVVRPNGHRIAVIVGVIVGLLVWFGAFGF
jgi:hypothetical protein